MTLHLTWPFVFEAIGITAIAVLLCIAAYSFGTLWLFAGGMKPRKIRITITTMDRYDIGDWLEISPGDRAKWKVVRQTGSGPYTTYLERKNR